MTDLCGVDVNKRTCTVAGCGKPHRAKGYCSTHYNQEFQPHRHAHSAEQSRARRERDKRDPERYAKELVRKNRKRKLASLETYETRLGLREIRAYIREREREPRLAQCEWCGTDYYATRPASLYCSESCSARASRARRRAREHAATGSYTWAEVTHVHLAIGGVCAYCWKPVSNADLQPDHVLALSRGGSNSITNIVPACAVCNGDKRELTLDEWAADRARRGLPPRSIHKLVTHLTTPGTNLKPF